VTEPELPTGKGRPTPKRKEARQQRRTKTPTTRKEAAAQRRERLRDQRGAQRRALATGDERHLPARDAGPAKRTARDVVDSRFTIGQGFFGVVILVIFLSFIPNAIVRSVANLALLLLFILLIADAIRVGRRAHGAVATKHGPKEATGITPYAVMRALQPRRMRRPPPKVKRGDQI
jgi:hypothetical protein